jgi:primosomal protein N' (replication factor Y) (superfamily II helicase)
MYSLFTQSTATARFADVILPLALPGLLTYGVPEEMQEGLLPGMRVEVSLGKNKHYSGIIARLHGEAPETYEVKPIRSIIDEVPVVSDIQLRFWTWIAQYYASAPGEVMQAALPAHLKLSAETRLQWAPKHPGEHEWSYDATPAVDALERRGAITISELRNLVGRKVLIPVLHELLHAEAVIINDALEPAYKRKTEKVISLAAEYQTEGALEPLFQILERAPKQMEALMSFLSLSVKAGPTVKQSEILADGKLTTATIKALIDRGVLQSEEQEVDRVAYTGKEAVTEISLTPAQEAAYLSMEEGLTEKGVVLLQGVTGSGKTLLYIRKIRECIARGEQALLLLPEIGLTTQLVRRLYAYFGEELGVYHSRFSNNERVEIWEKVADARYKVVVGPRSAIWLPFGKLGVIICDEEHDGSYKQRDPAPRFHARDAAIYLAGLHGAGTILGSATPSVESLYNVRQNKYAYAALKERYKGVKLPKIELINARSLEGAKKKGSGILTPELQEAMKAALEEKKQVILFQNRRGYAPFQICTMCGWVPECRNCAVSLTYHKSSDKMQCHYCGLATPVPHTCAQCGSNKLISRSFGTEKIEEEVKEVFPEARVARMDIDSMRGRNALSSLLDSMEAQETDILVGTQMVVKGLDFAPVALVAILNADSLLSYPDFRVNERGFQLMEQVAGRAGRADGNGRVLIQAYNLQHPALQWVMDHDVGAFYRHEIGYREFFAYPPFSRIIKLIFRHKEEDKAIEAAEQMASSLSKLEGIGVQGPAPSIIPRVRNQFVQELMLKCPKDLKVLDSVKTFLKDHRMKITGQKGLHEVQIVIDVDPV